MKRWLCQPYCMVQKRGLRLLQTWNNCRQLITDGKDKYLELCGETKLQTWKSEGQVWTSGMISSGKDDCNGWDTYTAWSKDESQSKHLTGVRLVSGKEGDREWTGQPRSKRTWKASVWLGRKLREQQKTEQCGEAVLPGVLETRAD